ncbi:DNA repair protein REV1 [Camelus ferus]|nr:DNA repair protein REV1 [Camelus ferus]
MQSHCPALGETILLFIPAAVPCLWSVYPVGPLAGLSSLLAVLAFVASATPGAPGHKAAAKTENAALRTVRELSSPPWWEVAVHTDERLLALGHSGARSSTMRRGGWRKRAENDGWENWGEYMAAKVQKLEQQFRSDAALQKDGTSSTIFSGVAIYVNGYTGTVNRDDGDGQCRFCDRKVISALDMNRRSIKAGRLLSYIPYQLYSKQSTVQRSLPFNPVCRPEDPAPGPSSVTRQLNDRVNHIIKKIETESEVRVGGVNNWKEEDAENDFGFVELEPIFPGRKQNRIMHPGDSSAICNGHAHSSCNGALQTQDCSAPPGHSGRLSPGPAEKHEPGVQQPPHSPGDTAALRSPHRTHPFSLPPLHSNTKINGAHHSSVPGPSSTKSTSSGPPLRRAAPSGQPRPWDCSFISDFYSRSRLHHISTWKCELTEFVNTLQRQSRKPVAVTSNRGTGRAPLRPGANPQLEWQYYQNKILKGKADTDFIIMGSAEDGTQVGIRNGMFFGQAKQLCPNLQAVPYDFHAYKEVARTMYETLASYTHNIEAVSCDEALVDITEILAETRLTPDEFASAVRTEIKDQTKWLRPVCPWPCAGRAWRSSTIAASSGGGKTEAEGLPRAPAAVYGVPLALASLVYGTSVPLGFSSPSPSQEAPGRASLRVSPVGEGVGHSMESKLTSLGIKTCGDLQYMTMAKLQKEFGPKTGQMLYRFCRGLDDRPVRTEKERKSVSAEINYGIRFTQPKEAEAFLLSLSEEIQRRLEAAGVKGKRLTLKIMVRKPGAPAETAKFGGHGICDTVTRTVTLGQAADSAQVIGKAALNMFQTMKVNISDMRGHRHIKMPLEQTEERAADMGKPEFTFLKDDPGQQTVCARTYVGIHVNQLAPAGPSPPARAARPSAQSGPVPGGSHSILDLLQAQKAQKATEEEHKEALEIVSRGLVREGFLTAFADSSFNRALPDTGPSVDPEVFAALPAELQKELKAAYDQRQRQGENPNPQQQASTSDPMEEDILQVVKYCTDLIEEKDLEKLDLVIKYMKRLMQQSVESVWNMAFDFILDNVQVVLQQTYGSTLKVTRELHRADSGLAELAAQVCFFIGVQNCARYSDSRDYTSRRQQPAIVSHKAGKEYQNA